MIVVVIIIEREVFAMTEIFCKDYNNSGSNDTELNDKDGNGLEEQEATNLYEISKIYADPKDRIGKWYDQDHDLFCTGTQGKTDGYRYNIGKKDSSLDYEMMNFQFGGYFRINKLTHLEDSTYRGEYQEAVPGGRHRSKY